MPDDHPGFALWPVDAAAHPYPVGNIDLVFGEEDGAKAEAELSLPAAQPTPQTVAERYIGVAHSAQLWFALECVTDVQGRVQCEAVLRGKHVHAFPEHGESDSGPLQEIRLSMGDLRGGGRREQLAPHGPHCDLFSVFWFQQQGKVRCELCVTHFRQTVESFLEMRERNRRNAERRPPIRIYTPPLPDPDAPEPKPVPKPEPGPDGAMGPGRPGGILAGILARVKRGLRVVFG